MATGARSGNRTQFLTTAAKHRFCLVAQGDPGNTAKVVETLALGGAGGCIPVFVLYAKDSDAPPEPVHFLRDYPHMAWLDYCRVAYFVTKHAALTDMPRVLGWLSGVSAADAASKFASLAAVRPAFVFTRDASVQQPAAGEFVLSEACQRARRMPLHAGVVAEETVVVAGGRHARCTLH